MPGFGDPARGCSSSAWRPPRTGPTAPGACSPGDRSGDWLFAALHRAGYANQPDVGLATTDSSCTTYITAAVRCAPPANKPTPEERDRCRPYLDRELALLDRVQVIVTLGAFGYEALWSALRDAGVELPRPRPRFGHLVEVPTARATILGCFHPSQQNTFTGKLTEPMLDAVFVRARELTRAPRISPTA